MERLKKGHDHVLKLSARAGITSYYTAMELNAEKNKYKEVFDGAYDGQALMDRDEKELCYGIKIKYMPTPHGSSSFNRLRGNQGIVS